MDYRRRKRALNHAQAHADEAPPARILQRDGIPQGAAEVLRTTEEVGEFAAHIAACGSFAFDTEFIGEESYYPRICLVQLATLERLAIIDPLQVRELGTIWELVVAPDVECIVHAGGQDIVTAQRGTGRPARGIIDTQIAAGLLNMPWPTSLANLIHALTDHRIAKGQTFTEWDKRPLTAHQLAYAADDVRYLPLSWSILRSRLTERGRLAWAEQECQADVDAIDAFDPDGQVKRASRGLSLRPRAVAIIREIVIARQQLARDVDRPPRTLLPDTALLELSRVRPTTIEELSQVRGVPKPLVASSGRAILDAVRRGAEVPTEADGSHGGKEDTADRMAVDALWSIVTMRCIAEGLAPTMVLSRARLARWYMARRRGASEPLFAKDDWRAEALGAWLSDFLDGRARFEIGWKGDGPVE